MFKINILVFFLSLEAPYPPCTVYLTAEQGTAGYSTDGAVPTDKPGPQGKIRNFIHLLAIYYNFVVVAFTSNFFYTFRFFFSHFFQQLSPAIHVKIIQVQANPAAILL